MIGLIVISESKASFELIETVKIVLGKKCVQGLIPLVIKSNFTQQTLKDRVNYAIKQLEPVDGIIIMSELYGSTQTNSCMDFLQKDFIELICGYNLSMLIKAASLNQKASLSQLISALKETGKKYILSFGAK